MKTIIVTGANSGLGLEAARQLTENSAWERILITARTQAKAEGAITTLREHTGAPAARFGYLLMDLLEPETVQAAVAQLESQGTRVDAVILNAGGMGAPESKALPKAADGTTKLFAMNVGGHAHFIHGLLARDLFNPGAIVVFSGSEASRGVPMLGARAPSLPEGDIDAAVSQVASGTYVQGKVDPMREYGLVKLVGIAWMQELAARHGDRLRAIAVSPGMTAGTAAMDEAPPVRRFMMRRVGIPLMRLMGRAHSVDVGAARYLQGLEDTTLVNGGFYASPNHGLTGALSLQSAETQPLLQDSSFAQATGRYLDALTGAATR